MKVQALSKTSTAPPRDGVPRIAIRIATPSAEPIWRDIVSTAIPVEKRSGGREAAAALESVGIVRPTPAPVSSSPGSISAA